MRFQSKASVQFWQARHKITVPLWFSTKAQSSYQTKLWCYYQCMFDHFFCIFGGLQHDPCPVLFMVRFCSTAPIANLTGIWLFGSVLNGVGKWLHTMTLTGLKFGTPLSTRGYKRILPTNRGLTCLTLRNKCEFTTVRQNGKMIKETIG